MKVQSKCILILCFLAASFMLKAQDSLHLSRFFKPQLRSDSLTSIKLNLVKYDVNKLPIFCKMEELWSKSSGMNVRFRIGDLQYVDKLEGKK